MGRFTMWMFLLWFVLVSVVVVVVYDLFQRKHAILRNFPLIGHLRYLLESVGPELRQYIVTNNDEERPFSRDERRWVYASSKGQNTYFGFGSDNEMELSPNYLIITHQAFPLNTPNLTMPTTTPSMRYRVRRCSVGADTEQRRFVVRRSSTFRG